MYSAVLALKLAVRSVPHNIGMEASAAAAKFPRGAVYAQVFATDATFQPEMSWLNAEADWNMLPCLQLPSGCYRIMRYPRYSYSAARAGICRP